MVALSKGDTIRDVSNHFIWKLYQLALKLAWFSEQRPALPVAGNSLTDYIFQSRPLQIDNIIFITEFSGEGDNSHLSYYLSLMKERSGEEKPRTYVSTFLGVLLSLQ